MQEHLKLYEDKMEKSLDVLLDEYASIRAGRANPHVLDRDPAMGEEPVKRD